MDFQEALSRLGFAPSDQRGFRQGDAQMLVAQPNPFLTYTVFAYADGTAIFSWEFALGEFLSRKGIQVGSDESLNQFMYPREDIRGGQDGTWLIGAVERTQAMLADLRFDRAGQ